MYASRETSAITGVFRVLKTHFRGLFLEEGKEAKRSVSPKELRSELCSMQGVTTVQNYWTQSSRCSTNICLNQ